LTSNGLGYINTLYDNISCPSCMVTGGTPISVTQGTTTSNINFALNTGGRISGTVTNSADGTPLANVTVVVFNASGQSLSSGFTNTSGQYVSGNGLPTGTYYARTSNSSGWVNKLYDNTVCLGCSETTGTPIAVTAGATTGGINFALAIGGRIVGRVTEASSGGALEGVAVAIFDSGGSYVTDLSTDPSGNYTTRFGLPAGSYFARTFDNGLGYIDKLYNGLTCVGCSGFPCLASCNVTTGTPIPVTSPNTTGNINFALSLPPVPAITSIAPSVVAVGGAAFTLTVNGTGFSATSLVQVNG